MLTSFAYFDNDANWYTHFWWEREENLRKKVQTFPDGETSTGTKFQRNRQRKWQTFQLLSIPNLSLELFAKQDFYLSHRKLCRVLLESVNIPTGFVALSWNFVIGFQRSCSRRIKILYHLMIVDIALVVTRNILIGFGFEFSWFKKTMFGRLKIVLIPIDSNPSETSSLSNISSVLGDRIQQFRKRLKRASRTIIASYRPPSWAGAVPFNSVTPSQPVGCNPMCLCNVRGSFPGKTLGNEERFRLWLWKFLHKSCTAIVLLLCLELGDAQRHGAEPG